jgi:hypothetical protein
LERLFPEPGPTSVVDQLDGYRPWDDPPAGRPRVALNFASTLDGRASIEGRSGQIGSDTDTAMLVGLRQRFDAVMIGAGTMREERYGRLVTDPQKRARREALGLPGDLPMVIVGSLDLPWDADLFTDGGGRVIIFTSAEDDPPATATPVDVIRATEGRVDVAAALGQLRGRPAPALAAPGAGAGRRALPHDRAETGRRRPDDPRGGASRGRRARPPLAPPRGLRALRSLPPAMN